MEVRLYQNLLEFNWNLLFTAVTVFVLYLILKHFFFEKVHNFMMARKAMIEEELMNADQESKKASKLLEEYSRTLANAEEEKRQIIKEAKVIADERADAIVSDAKKEAAQIIVDAHKKIEAEEEKAVSQLKKDIGKLAVLTAEQIMQKELGDEDRQELVDKVIEEAGSGKWKSQ